MGINRRDRNREHWFVMNTYTRSNDRVETLLGNARDVAYFIPKQYAVRTFNGGTADISGWRGRNQEYSVIFAPWNI